MFICKNCRERKCGRSSREGEFAQKRINILFNLKGLLYSPVGRPEGSPPTASF